MPDYDLSSANLCRVAGEFPDLLRIAGQTVWEKPAELAIREIVDAPLVSDANWSASTGAGTQVGDVLAVFHFAHYYSAADMGEPSGTSGAWTLQETADGQSPTLKLWTRTVSVAGAQTIILPRVEYAQHGGAIYVLSGTSELNIEDTNSANGDTTSGHTTPSVVATSTGALCLRAVGTRGGNGNSYTWPTSTERTDRNAGSGTGGGVWSTASRVLSAAGATGTEVCTGSAVSNWGEFVSIAAIFGAA